MCILVLACVRMWAACTCVCACVFKSQALELMTWRADDTYRQKESVLNRW